MGKAEHYKKKQERENINRLLSYMKEKGSVSFGEGKAYLNVSSVTMTSYLRHLAPEIEHYEVLGEGKKKKRYKLKKKSLEKVDAQIGKYKATQFIEGISNPIYYGKKKASVSIVAFSSVPATINREKWGKNVQNIVNRFPLRLIPELKNPQQKIAVVIMAEGKEGVES